MSILRESASGHEYLVVKAKAVVPADGLHKVYPPMTHHDDPERIARRVREHFALHPNNPGVAPLPMCLHCGTNPRMPEDKVCSHCRAHGIGAPPLGTPDTGRYGFGKLVPSGWDHACCGAASTHLLTQSTATCQYCQKTWYNPAPYKPRDMILVDPATKKKYDDLVASGGLDPMLTDVYGPGKLVEPWGVKDDIECLSMELFDDKVWDEALSKAEGREDRRPDVLEKMWEDSKYAALREACEAQAARIVGRRMDPNTGKIYDLEALGVSADEAQQKGLVPVTDPKVQSMLIRLTHKKWNPT